MVGRTPPAQLKATCTADEWRFATQPDYARRVVFERDQGACAQCDEADPQWELDHKIPLFSLFSLEISHWTINNTQTLCQRCHTRKSSAEAATRGKNQRLQKQLEGKPKRKRTTRKVSGEVIMPKSGGLPWETRDGYTTIDIGKSKRR